MPLTIRCFYTHCAGYIKTCRKHSIPCLVPPHPSLGSLDIFPNAHKRPLLGMSSELASSLDFALLGYPSYVALRHRLDRPGTGFECHGSKPGLAFQFWHFWGSCWLALDQLLERSLDIGGEKSI